MLRSCRDLQFQGCWRVFDWNVMVRLPMPCWHMAEAQVCSHLCCEEVHLGYKNIQHFLYSTKLRHREVVTCTPDLTIRIAFIINMCLRLDVSITMYHAPHACPWACWSSLRKWIRFFAEYFGLLQCVAVGESESSRQIDPRIPAVRCGVLRCVAMFLDHQGVNGFSELLIYWTICLIHLSVNTNMCTHMHTCV